MDAQRFDRITRQFGVARFNRRTALGGGGAAFATAALGMAQHAAAQEATPTGSPAAVAPGGEKTTYLFAQPFDGGRSFSIPRSPTPTS